MSQVSAELTSGTAVSITNGRHHWRADEPGDAGGTDKGPNPYDLLLGSLAACTCITIAMYCRHKGMTLHSVKASFEFENIHADDCEDCDGETTGLIERITSSVHISGDFDEPQKKRLAQIATRCPVHKTMANGIRFRDNATFD
jgi:putative redox protein